MDTINIITDKSKTFLHLNNNQIFGYIFNNDNTIEEIDTNYLKVFDFIFLSSNNIQLDNYKGYNVYLDKNTNFKHYLSKNKENYDLFFYNNGEDATCYKNTRYRKGNTRVFTYKGKRFYIGKKSYDRLIALLLMISLSTGSAILAKNIIPKKKIESPITIEDICQDIYSSSHLSFEDKQYLYNRDYFELILPIINESNANKYYYLLKYKDIEIIRYDREEDSNVIGWYNMGNPNIINIDSEFDDDKTIEDTQSLNHYVFIKKEYMPRNDVLSHEFIHLSQVDYQYKLITEASAEILSSEFFNYTMNNSYYKEIKLTKKLMEIIGSYPVLYYNFSGDMSLIEQEVKPYLGEEKYNMFLFCLQTSSSSDEMDLFDYKSNQLDILLNELYKNRYGKLSSEDEAIYAIDNDKAMERWYFNPKYTSDSSKSLYYDNELDFEEAFNNGLMRITYKKDGEERPFLTFNDYILSDEDPDYDVSIKFSDDVTVSGSKVICDDFVGAIRPLIPIGQKDFTPSTKQNNMSY